MRRAVSLGGFQISDYFRIQKIHRSLLPPREISFLSIPARHGAYFTGARYGVRQISMDVTVIGQSATEYMETIRFLAYCLDIEEPAELIISDEPGKLYYAILSGNTDMVNNLMRVGSGILTFICPDPFAYSIESKVITPVDQMFTFKNEGTTTTFPKFTVNFENEATFVSFISPDGVILIGNPSEPDQIVLPKTQYILNDAMKSTSGWVNAGAVLDTGRLNTGSVIASGEVIKASSYGTGTAGSNIWHGPAIRKDLVELVKDFTVKVRLDFFSQDGTSKLDGAQKGRLEIYLFNQSGGKIGKLVMRDSYKNYENNIPEIYIGNSTFLEKESKLPAGKKVKQKVYKTYTVKKDDTWESIAKKYKMSAKELATLNKMRKTDTLKTGKKLQVYDKTITKTVYPEHVGSYNDFYGEFTLSRVGNKWYAEVSRLDDGKKKNTIKKTFYDKEGKYTTADLSYIVIHFAQWENEPVVQKMQVTDVKVIKHNTDTVIDVPAIFDAGDELEVDLSDSSVYLNGDPFMQEVDVASTFFPISEGTTQVKVNTDDPTATFSAEFQERYL
ncbi:distal tail protein Dit [Neobacillus drentensis]|uniref:distal tail protein Dit n=1 Tax=Neobacillus drentensis TaxID=220684 RepID=UPI002FFDD0C5